MKLPQTQSFITELKDYQVFKPITVEWGEMDAAGIINNTIYLKWFEAARVKYLADLSKGESFDMMNEDGVVLAQQTCKYIFPVTFPDTIWIGVGVSEILEDRFVMDCKMMSEKHDRIVAIAQSTLVPFDFQKHQKAPMNADAKQKILSLENRLK